MISETDGGSPRVSFGRQPAKNFKSACSNVVTKYRKLKINAVRDYPEECGSHGRTVADTLKDLVQDGMSGLVCDSEPEEVPVAESTDHVGLNMPMALDTQELSSLSNSVKHEAINLSKKVVVETLPRIYPPHRGISAIRCFPKDCGRKATQINNKFSQDRTPFLKGMSFEETVKSDTHRKKARLQIMPRVYPPRRRIWAKRWFPEGCGRKAPQFSKEVQQQAIVCTGNDSISQCGSLNQLHERLPFKSALPVHRVIVLGLMAAKCPWRQRKKTPKSNGDRAIGRDEKH